MCGCIVQGAKTSTASLLKVYLGSLDNATTSRTDLIYCYMNQGAKLSAVLTIVVRFIAIDDTIKFPSYASLGCLGGNPFYCGITQGAKVIHLWKLVVACVFFL